jgi:hypothetical protein
MGSAGNKRKIKEEVKFKKGKRIENKQKKRQG